MPTYSYLCSQCKKAFDYFHLGTEDKTPTCPHCGSKDETHKRAITNTQGHVVNGASAKNRYGLKRY